MKVTSVETISKFKPITLNITLETTKEVECFYAILNHCINCEFMLENSGVDLGDIRSVIRNQYRLVDYREMFNKLNEKINEGNNIK